MVEGPRPALEGLLEDLHRGPYPAEVAAVDIEWQVPSGNFRDFDVA